MTGSGSDLTALGEFAEWLAGAQARFPPTGPVRPRCLVLGPVTDAVAALAASLDVGVRAVDLSNHAGTEHALEYGAELADDEIDSGTDLLVVAGPPTGPAAAVVVSLVAGAEPVALLPRGEGAIDTAAWIAQAEQLRDARHAAADLRDEPTALLARLGDVALAAATGLVLRAAARRTPIVLDGVTAVVAALLAADVQSRAGRWWCVADTSPDPVQSRAVAELDEQPLLDLGTATGDGTAGLLTVPLLRAATSNPGAVS